MYKIVLNPKQTQYMADVIMEFIPKYGIEAFIGPKNKEGKESDVSQSKLPERKGTKS
ncbi:hypothetical protein P4U05_17100 [Bacillus paranthracis]|nr:hypothetical protein [Bacillus paranthracis]ADY20326.1 hypothetical protein YBT020_05400 [Bacillus thuringiensis serovar finitimus YBT-020]MRC72822.1 hypothetical protein [Bacillus thuringiensis]MCR6799395.1 hypothetical protein [Bacillus paranthracis]MEC3358445.1 hypothetical protein [Bacillus paranthracis]MED0785440.1 hypothetical protein [Bacillus paranthracis]